VVRNCEDYALNTAFPILSLSLSLSLLQNKAKALKVLCAKLYEIERSRIQISRSKLRSEQVQEGMKWILIIFNSLPFNLRTPKSSLIS
jgi:hypothetical protein